VTRRVRRLLVILAVGLLVLAAVLVIAFLEGDLPDFDPSIPASILQGKGSIGAVALLYLEESGVPMPVPGDFFVMYIGRQTAGQPLLLVAAWLGLIATVVLGSTNLYMLARRFGRRWVDGRLGRILHITPERMARAEIAFRRWGVLAIIFGRHIPGFRVPITIVAGTFRTPYPVFAASVAVSTAVWAGVFLIVGVKIGARVQDFLNAHHSTYLVVAGVVAIAVGYVVFRVVRAWSPAVVPGVSSPTPAPHAEPDLPAWRGGEAPDLPAGRGGEAPDLPAGRGGESSSPAAPLSGS
jgi:membrane protein DedA with SNARE-associated domain